MPQLKAQTIAIMSSCAMVLVLTAHSCARVDLSVPGEAATDTNGSMTNDGKPGGPGDANSNPQDNPNGMMGGNNSTVMPGNNSTIMPGNNGGGPACDAPLTYFPDNDGDGAGDAAGVSIIACAPVPNHVDNNGDCDDTNPAVNPAAAEIEADGIDQNCDGVEMCFVDADNDGHRVEGVPAVPSEDADCDDEGEALATDPATDCDDNDGDKVPGGPEVCDGVDNNCNDQIDEVGGCTCDIVNNNGHTYFFCNEDRPWTSAQDQCVILGHALVVINDQPENDFVYGEINNRGFEDTWIGFHDQQEEGIFRWATGTISAYSNWDGGEPNDGGNGGEDCAVLMTTRNREAQWDDRECNSARPYVCESTE